MTDRMVAEENGRRNNRQTLRERGKVAGRIGGNFATIIWRAGPWEEAARQPIRVCDSVVALKEL